MPCKKCNKPIMFNGYCSDCWSDLINLEREVNPMTRTYNIKSKKECLIKECATIASGTICSLIASKDRSYHNIDTVRSLFVRYAEAYYDEMQWETWVDAWNSFRKYITGIF